MPKSRPRPEPSLRRRLLIRLWLPLLGVLLAGAFVSAGLAVHFGNVAHDRWLLDSALALATQLRSEKTGPRLTLPPSAVEMFEWDSVDQIFEDVTDAEGDHLFGNASFPRRPGLVPADVPKFYDEMLAGRPVRVVAIAVTEPPPQSKTVVIQVAETLIKRKTLVREIVLMTVPLQVIILLLAGAFIWYAVTSSLSTLDATASRLRTYSPEHLMPVDSARVPSEVKPLIVAIDQLIGKLAEAREAQQRFVANAAHQLRTPLAALQVQTERASRETDPRKHAEALDEVIKSLSRMRHLTQQLLTLSRADASSANMLRMEPVDLAQLARNEIERWADAAIERNIDLGYDGPEKGTIVHGEPRLLSELLGNLIDNAIQYAGAGASVTVGVRAHPPTLFVEDDGPGILAQERGHVFEPFYRVRGSEGAGCGLGLTIAHEIAARHQATLGIVDTRDARGVRIEVAFTGSPAASGAEAGARAGEPLGA